MSDAYTPRAGSAQERILAFLRRHAGELVPAATIAEKCGVSHVGAAMKALIAHGLVEREGSSSASRYRLADASVPPSDGKLTRPHLALELAPGAQLQA